MAQTHRTTVPVVTQLRCDRTYMTNAAATRIIANPVETTRGQISRITLIVPTFGPARGANRQYLVARIPQERVLELTTHLATLPPAQREPFVRTWIERNQQSMINAYFGNQRDRFNFDFVPHSAVTVSPTPRRTVVQPQPTPRRTETPTPRRTITTPPPPQVTTPVEPVVPGPTPRPRATREQVDGVTGGSGTRSAPYQVRYTVGRGRTGLGATETDVPFTFYGRRYVARVNLAQLADSRVATTYTGILSIIRQHVARLEHGAVRLNRNLAQFKENIRTSLRGQGAEGRRMIQYLDTH
ncbi:hypothetical protein KKE92_01550 [Candidatus Micrarchaeota archaeon]|nr:hypothetical protein [Candidatus Micrarchaeota archaeon]MBU1681913.1 hypothetical protein [Candidatus Micrarchaeota archaeon]